MLIISTKGCFKEWNDPFCIERWHIFFGDSWQNIKPPTQRITFKNYYYVSCQSHRSHVELDKELGRCSSKGCGRSIQVVTQYSLYLHQGPECSGGKWEN